MNIHIDISSTTYIVIIHITRRPVVYIYVFIPVLISAVALFIASFLSYALEKRISKRPEEVSKA